MAPGVERYIVRSLFVVGAELRHFNSILVPSVGPATVICDLTGSFQVDDQMEFLCRSTGMSAGLAPLRILSTKVVALFHV
jgi:hypothetical protein